MLHTGIGQCCCRKEITYPPKFTTTWWRGGRSSMPNSRNSLAAGNAPQVAWPLWLSLVLATALGFALRMGLEVYRRQQPVPDYVGSPESTASEVVTRSNEPVSGAPTPPAAVVGLDARPEGGEPRPDGAIVDSSSSDAAVEGTHRALRDV